MPVFLFYMAYGAETIAVRFGNGFGRFLPSVAIVVFTCGMAVAFVCIFGMSSSGADTVRTFVARCDAEMPTGCSVGVWGNSGVAYGMSSRRIAHLSGIYSPEFLSSKPMAGKFEILKNEPQHRFDYWMAKVSDKKSIYCDKPEIVAGDTVFSGHLNFELRKADWSAYDAAARAPSYLVSNCTLAAQIDVAYEKDERQHCYEALTRDDYPLFAPFHIVGKLNGTNIVEGGRFLFGGDAMTVTLKPGEDVHVVMRTALKCTAAVDREIGIPRSDFTLKSPMTLKVLVEGEDVGDISFPVAEGDVTDATFVIPGRFIRQPQVRLAFLGEHVAFAYWFFQ